MSSRSKMSLQDYEREYAAKAEDLKNLVVAEVETKHRLEKIQKEKSRKERSMKTCLSNMATLNCEEIPS